MQRPPRKSLILGADADLATHRYQSFWTAWRISQGIEAVHMIRKGRVRWVAKGDPLGQLQFIDGLFGLTI